VHPFEIENSILLLVSFALLCVKSFALVDVVTRRPEVFPAADRQTKALWLILLSVALVAHLVFWNPIGHGRRLGLFAGRTPSSTRPYPALSHRAAHDCVG
jgi:hypothetical protein